MQPIPIDPHSTFIVVAMAALVLSCLFAFFMFLSWTEEHKLRFSMPAIGIPPIVIGLLMLLWLLIAAFPLDPYFNLAIFMAGLGVVFGWLGYQAEGLYKYQQNKLEAETAKTIETRLAEYLKRYPDATPNAIEQERKIIAHEIMYKRDC